MSGVENRSWARAPSGNPGKHASRFAWLAVGLALLLVANGRWILPLAAWLAPIGWLVFLERSRAVAGVALAFVLYVLVNFIAWRGLIPAPGVLYYIIAGTYALVYFLPFAIHRVIVPRLPAFASTLTFPLAWVGIEFVFHRWITPYGSWFSLAYTQPDHLSLLQVASLAGTGGVSFLMTWFSATAAAILRAGTDSRTQPRLAAPYALTLVAALVFGQIRLAGSAVEGEAIRVAGIVPDPSLARELESALVPVRQGEQLEPDDLDRLAAIAERLNLDLLARSRREAQAGARLVAWSETGARVLARDEPALLAAAQQLAAEEDVDLILGYGVWYPDEQPPLANKVTAVNARGEIAWDYHKAHPIVGAESPFVEKGGGEIRVLETAYGRVGAVICHDLDFPALMRQASRQRIGLVVGPSADWRAITPLHADMSILRAIENGFALLRPTSGGRSIATDPQGRVVGLADYTEDAIVTYVSAVAVGTVYGVIGDLFAWLCLVGLIAILATTLLRQARWLAYRLPPTVYRTLPSFWQRSPDRY